MFPQIFGKYVLTREIAAGGMARVFLATLRGAGGFEKRLVVKQIRPELGSDQSFVERFVAEAKTAVELSHSNIVPVYELGAEQGTYYIAMEFCEGVPLSQLLSDGPLSPAEGAYIGVEICRALDYAHRKAGIVHRDVTPRNVMLDQEGMVRLIDFGIAAPARAEALGGEPLFGSPGHMPPEQLGRGPLTPAADVFAVAALLIEIWTGRAPFRRESFEASVRALGESPPDLAAADASLAALAPLIRAALAHEPSARPQTAEELARPLREFLRSSDLGDIARRLGQRVTERMARPTRPGEAQATLELSASAAAPGATRSFAMREALREWTAKIASEPPAPSEPALRVGTGRVPPSSDAGLGATHELQPPSAPARPAARLGPWVLLAGAVALAGLGLRTPLAGTPAPAHADPGLPSSASAAAPLAPPLPAPASPETAAPASRRLEPAPLSERPRPSAPDLVQAPAPHASSVRTRPAPPPRNAHAASPLPPTQLQITAEPPALVRIDATLIGRTPVLNLPLAPGPHEFVFESEQLGERLEAKLDVAGTRRRVHADFTSAAPQVYLR